MDAISRRLWLTGALAGIVDLGVARASHAATLASEERAVAGFDSVIFDAAGELSIEQSNREHLRVEAEPAVLAKIITEVRERRLHIRFGPGSVQTQQPIRFRLELKTLAALEANGSGSVRVAALSTTALSLRLDGSTETRLAQLTARTLDARLDGASELTVDAGRVDSQRIVISGSGRYAAQRLASRVADVAIDGSGESRVAVAERLSARITGSGELLFSGHPQVVQSVTGSGEIRRLGS